MLTKENTKKAERIAEELEPLFFRAYELGAIYDNTRERLHKAHSVKNAYYYTTRQDCAAAGLDFDTIQAMKHSHDPATVKEWDKLYNKSLKKESRAEDAHTVAAFNFKNYFDYFAALIADYIRPYWHEFAQRGGLSTLADIINRNATKDHTAGAVSVSICLDRAEFDPKNPTAPGAFVRVSVTICPGWACGISGYIGKYYQNNPGEVWHSAELPPVLDIEKCRTGAGLCFDHTCHRWKEWRRQPPDGRTNPPHF